MIPKRVLLVDDEPTELEGLRSLLDPKGWEIVCARDGRAALDELAAAPVDVVVSNLVLPGLDGVELLRSAKRMRPAAARIGLSAATTKEAMVGALSVAHQVLARPCEPATLKEVIDRTCSLQSLTNDQAVRDVVGKVGALPSIPRTYWELTAALARPSIGLGALAEIVSRDPPMSARVLQIVNSAYFGLERRITSIREAVTFLGVDALKGLALTSHVFSSANAPTHVAAALERLQRSSMAVARLAKGFVPDPDRSEETFSAAIVHDVGKIVLTMSMSEAYREVAAEVMRSRRPTHVVERERLGVTHAAVGAYLLGVWGLPIPIVEAVAYHHEPSLAPEEVREIVAAVHVADALVDAVIDGPGSDSELDLPFLGSIGWTERLPRLRALAAVELKWLRAMGA